MTMIIGYSFKENINIDDPDLALGEARGVTFLKKEDWELVREGVRYSEVKSRKKPRNRRFVENKDFNGGKK